jgi:trehalose 6-phosphate synthase/phosphatase
LTRRGFNVLVRQEYRPTLADAWIKPPAALLEFLRGWVAACRVN